jgi:hypothetical protein
MKAWQWVLVAASVLNGLISAGLFFTGHSQWIQSGLAAAFLPVFISTVMLFVAENVTFSSAQALQSLNIIGFFVKILLIGGWVALLISTSSVQNVIFIVILVINFLVWHGVEAYYWPLFMAGRGKTGENS